MHGYTVYQYCFIPGSYSYANPIVKTQCTNEACSRCAQPWSVVRENYENFHCRDGKSSSVRALGSTACCSTWSAWSTIRSESSAALSPNRVKSLLRNQDAGENLHTFQYQCRLTMHTGGGESLTCPTPPHAVVAQDHQLPCPHGSWHSQHLSSDQMKQPHTAAQACAF